MASIKTRPRGSAIGVGVLVARLVDEEIDALASPMMRRGILASALMDAGHESMPVDPDVLSVFVRTALREAMELALGAPAAYEICERLCAMLPAPPPMHGASTTPPPVFDEPLPEEISAVIPRDTLRLAASTDTIWIVATDLRSAKALANELGELGMTARIAPSVPPLRGTRCALILDLRGAPEATAQAWLARGQESETVVVAWGGAIESDAANVYDCESALSEREVAVYCASLLV
jgi:hypothetical protein